MIPRELLKCDQIVDFSWPNGADNLHLEKPIQLIIKLMTDWPNLLIF
jgi:hypothetical protein